MASLRNLLSRGSNLTFDPEDAHGGALDDLAAVQRGPRRADELAGVGAADPADGDRLAEVADVELEQGDLVLSLLVPLEARHDLTQELGGLEGAVEGERVPDLGQVGRRGHGDGEVDGWKRYWGCLS